VILLGALTLLVGTFTIELSTNSILQILIQTTVVGSLFFAPIYFLKLEQETVGFTKAILERVRKFLKLR
jgi:hypothetical protein